VAEPSMKEFVRLHQKPIRKGPRAIFIDLGPNNGKSLLRFLLGKMPYLSFQNRNKFLDLTNDAIKSITNPHCSGRRDCACVNIERCPGCPVVPPEGLDLHMVDVYSVEPNLKHEPTLVAMFEGFPNIKGLLTGTGVWNETTTLNFGIAACDKRETRLGDPQTDFHAVDSSKDVKPQCFHRTPVIDICEYLYDYVGAKKEDYVAIKLDTENAEIPVLTRLLEGCLEVVDFLAFEWGEWERNSEERDLKKKMAPYKEKLRLAGLALCPWH